MNDNLLDDIENHSDDEAVFLDDISSLSAYTTPTLMPDCELNAMIRSLNHKQRTIFNIVHNWAKQNVKSRSALSRQNLEPLYIYFNRECRVWEIIFDEGLVSVFDENFVVWKCVSR